MAGLIRSAIAMAFGVPPVEAAASKLTGVVGETARAYQAGKSYRKKKKHEKYLKKLEEGQKSRRGWSMGYRGK